MNKEYGGMKLWWLFIPMGIGLIGLILGSFLDLSISNSIASTTSFLGMSSEAFGEVFGYMCAPISGAILFAALYKDEKIGLKILAWVSLAVGIGFPTYFFGKASARDNFSYGLNKIAAYGIAALIMVGTFVVTYYLVRNKDKKTLIKVGASIAIAMLTCLFFQTIIKDIVGRPRYRFLMSEDGVGYSFKEWWQWDFFRSGKPTDSFKSFPSGHTIISSITYSLVSLTTLSENKAKKSNIILFVCAVIYSLFIAFCRVRGGAHFLSDVSMGLIIGSSVNMIVRYFVYRKEAK